MKIPENINLKLSNVLKIAGLVIIAIIIIALAFRLIGSSVNSWSSNSGIKITTQNSPDYDTLKMYESSEYGVDSGVADLSIRNITPNPISTGDDAEEFEITQYNSLIETQNLEKTCGEIAILKSRDDVIFENSNEYEKSCSYNFKVKKDSVAEILSIIEDLNPKELNANTYTIKNVINDYTNEVEILEKKMSSIEETLANAVSAYDDITQLATQTKDVESLAKIIDSKIQIIERLTQEKINITTQLDRLSRSKAEQLDRLDYTYFNVYVLENKFIDGQNLKDSWKTAIKSFVRDINGIIQDVTINLVALLLLALQYIIYAFIILIIAKYCWKIAKNIWKK